MINATSVEVKPPAVYTVRQTGTFLQPDQVPAAWAPIPDGVVTGGYRAKRITQFDHILATDPKDADNVYMLTGTFRIGAEDSTAESVHLRPQLTGDFDLVDYASSTGHECITYTEAEADTWLQCLAEKKRGDMVQRNRFLKKLAKRKMYEYAEKNPDGFNALFSQFKNAFLETMVTNFFPPTYLMMSGWGLHCLWHLTPDDIRAQVNEPALSYRVKTVNEWLVKVINSAHAKSVGESVTKPGGTVLPEMDAAMSAPGNGSLCYPGVKNLKCPTNHRQTFTYKIGDGSSGVALSMEAIHAKLSASGIAEGKDNSGDKPADGSGKAPKGSGIGSGTPDANGFTSYWKDFAKEKVRVTPDGELTSLAELADVLGVCGKLKVIDPLSGSSTGSGWIQKDNGKPARLINDAAKTIWYDNRGGYAEMMRKVGAKFVTCAANLALVLENDERLGYKKLSFDTFTQELFIDGNPLPDGDNFFQEIRVTISGLFSMEFDALKTIRPALYHAAKKNSFDSLHRFITSLPAWDGTTRIDSLFRKAYHTAKHNAFVDIASRKSMIGWAVRALSYDKPVEMHTAPVLQGDHGSGKSEFIKALFYHETHPQFHKDTKLAIDGTNKNSLAMIQGTWIYEMGELAGLAKSDNESIKGWLSSSVDSVRKVYATESVNLIRRCCFIGTCNPTAFLRDDTGNRRLLPVKTNPLNGRLDAPQFNREWVLANRDQLWAEARDIAQAWIDAGRDKFNAPWNLTQSDRVLLGTLTEAHSVANIEKEHGKAWLDDKVDAWIAAGSPEEERPTVTMVEFLQQGLRMGTDINVINNKNNWKADIMVQCGWARLEKQVAVRDAKGNRTGSRTLVYEYRP